MQEEEYFTKTYDFDFLTDISTAELDTLLTDAEAAILASGRSVLPVAGSNSSRGKNRKRTGKTASGEHLVNPKPTQDKATVSAAPLSEDEAVLKQLCEDLLARLRMRRSFFAIIQQFYQGQKVNMPVAKSALQTLQSQLDIMKRFREGNPRKVDNFKRYVHATWLDCCSKVVMV